MNLSKIFIEKMYVGFSASTGNITSDHYVIGWSFSREGRAKDFDLTLLPSLSSSSDFDPISSPPSDSATLNTKVIIVSAFAVMVFYNLIEPRSKRIGLMIIVLLSWIY